MLQRARKALRVAQTLYRDSVIDFRYLPGDEFRTEFAELKEFMRRAFQLLSYNGIAGDYAEFGCFGARTFSLAYNASRLIGYDARFWAFDSFQGLPASDDERDEHPGWTRGEMAMSEERFRDVAEQRGVPRDAYTTIPGFFNETLVDGAAGPRPERISFAYVDCDLYSSTVDVLRFLDRRIVNGTVIAFDDWFCNGAEGPSGERRAALEAFGHGSRWSLLPYRPYSYSGMSFIVEG